MPFRKQEDRTGETQASQLDLHRFTCIVLHILHNIHEALPIWTDSLRFKTSSLTHHVYAPAVVASFNSASLHPPIQNVSQ